MNDFLLVGAFVISALFIIYHHVGYPLLLKWYSKRHPLSSAEGVQRHFKTQHSDTDLPSIAVIVPAFNEERWIETKIRNLACLDYPRDKLKVYVLCDGCTDKTVELAHETIQDATCADTWIEIIDGIENRGKVARINEFIPKMDSELIALSDVSALITFDALLIAAEHFKNRSIGVVNPSYQLFDQTNLGESKYWKYQSDIKKAETTFGSTLGSHGAFYLFRRSLFTPLPANTINDDFIIPMQIVQRGYIAHYDDNMVALELEPTNQKNDFQRRLRISAGNMQQVIKLWPLFNPKNLGIAFSFFSGKGLRLLTPYLMLICLFSSIYLTHYDLFSTLLNLQIALYIGTFIGSFVPLLRNTKVMNLAMYLLIGHLANLIGGLRYLFKAHGNQWSKTPL